MPVDGQGSALEAPAHFVKLPREVTEQATVAKADLGKRLFFDPILSADSTVSCGSCHLPELAFTDGKAIAVGIAGRRGQRNAPTLANLAWAGDGLFWDGRSPGLEAQVSDPIHNPNELGSDWATVISRLRGQADYQKAFRSAFGASALIDSSLVKEALAQYQRALISAESKYDRAMRGEAVLTASEARGKHIFFDSSAELPDGECGHCHTPPLFTDQTYMNNGVQEQSGSFEYADAGRGGHTGIRFDNGRFRVPSLRNIALTAPYMHDGRFATLEEVVAHYNRGGHPGPNVDPKIRPLGLSASEQADLVAFLKTLTDTAFVEYHSRSKNTLQ